MEQVKFEIEKRKQETSESAQLELRELGDLQLALVGGGIGEVILG